MKKVLLFSILFCANALPTLGELTVEDLEKIRSIVSESEERVTAEIDKINTKIDKIDTRLRTVETDVAELRGQKTAFSIIKDWGIALCALGALIVSIIALAKKFSAVPHPTDEQYSQTAKQL